MTTESINQTINQLRKSSNILILISGGDNPDAVAASLALKEFLARQEKQLQIVTKSPVIPRLKFLPQVDTLTELSSLSKNLVVEVSLQKTPLSELRYQKQDHKLSIFLTPKFGQFDPSDVEVKSSVYPFDLIVTIGVSNLDELGLIYANHAPMFFEIPVINIDHRASNESFGQINLVNLTASALSEVVMDLIEEYDKNFIDEKIATLLLAGLVAQTNSFQSQKTTPQVFHKASRLVALGGRQQDIVTQLYKSKSLGLLRLWGRVLARLKHDSENQIAYSAVSKSDIEKSEALPSDLDEIIFEMSQTLNFAKIFAFFVEDSEQSTDVYVAGSVPISWSVLFSPYNPTSLSSQAVKFNVKKSLANAENEIVLMITQELTRLRA